MDKKNLEQRLKEPQTVMDCIGGDTRFFVYGVCIVSRQYKCRYQGSLKDVQGRQYLECTLYKERRDV